MPSDLHARYAKAEALLPHNLTRLIQSPQVSANWIKDTERFWYRNRTDEGVEFTLVDAQARTKGPAFDRVRLAKALEGLVGKEFDPTDLPFFDMEFVSRAMRVDVEGQRVEVSLDSYAVTVLGPAQSGEKRSPDGRWAVGLREHNLYIRDLGTGEERRLTTDGTEAHAYASPADSAASRVMQENLGITAPPLIVWSPDSSRFITHRLDQRDCELMHLVRSAPPDGGRPKLMTYRYSMVGDEHLATAEFMVFDAATGDVTRAKCEPVLMPYVSAIQLGQCWWKDDGTTAYWLAGDRGERTARLHALDPGTGEVTVLVEETSETTVQYGPHFPDRNVRVLDSGEVLWWSERSGWGHLYLYGTDGMITTVTSGDWMVRHIVCVDEARRRVVFTASGREPGVDVYLQELYSASLDGGDITRLTRDGLDHDAQPSLSGRYFVDVMAWPDTPAVSVLRDSTGAVVMELERTDASALFEAGFTPAERVVVKAADGETDLTCSVHKPHDFDPAQKYPVVDEIYPGPWIGALAHRFPLSGGVMAAERNALPFAALGFVHVALDHRGTPLRGKVFQEHARLVGDGQYVDDHVAAIKQLAQSRPWMDLDRVGIFGHSGGGYASTRAMLQQPGFFKVAVSSAGDHDDGTYHSWWGEKYFGLVDEFDFAAHANASLAGNLRGKLLLAHGEMDDNVTPHLTMRLVDALIAANKDFDLLIVPNADHRMLVNQAYWLRRRWDYFVRHLLGEAPPEYRIADIPLDPEALAALGGG
ncbi:DPP IV N-terminal domain-containing protein [Streptomyces parvulus]|uniref:S9 family peptidase n=1 Tax=Streptomyces parvulus TaxID=146923 RepID=A0A369UWW5_9ACTN|nr:DPP IV N-terminal domain-containing protein [Streptomyces parvulus]RDD85282.1 S9 family peptidase [Streptomyces parvulus]